VIEDTDVTYEELSKEFGSRVADAVEYLAVRLIRKIKEYEVFTNSKE
jgi:(p)ppGpp synthase/HD superfamily hydrolase